MKLIVRTLQAMQYVAHIQAIAFTPRQAVEETVFLCFQWILALLGHQIGHADNLV